MTAHEHFEQLITSYFPRIQYDRDSSGKVTDEARDTAVDWAWKQMTEAEHIEFYERCREEQLEESWAGFVATGRIVLIPGEGTYYDANEYRKHEKVKAGIDALVAAGSHYRGQDDEETGEARFFAV
ncbi:MAG TPA: hypothetical protein VK638_44210 [Edaphobacter sp.]|nr:hypothetical protein [Edaphobacter sp.]